LGAFPERKRKCADKVIGSYIVYLNSR
jgi:hypothetical protein